MPQAKSPMRNLPMASGSAPVHALHLRNGEPGQQRSRGWKRVEGSQILPVGDKPLKDAPRQVVRVVDSPVASTSWAVSNNSRKMLVAASPGSCSKMSLAMAKIGQ